MALDSWLAQPHVATPPKMCAEDAAARTDNAVIVDNLLREDVLAKLLPLFELEGVWKDLYGISADPTKVGAAEFEAAEPQQRLYRLLAIDEERLPAAKLTPPWIAWIFLSQFFGSQEFLRFVSDASGVAPTRFQGYEWHIMQRGHFINPHSDNGKGRILCGVLYLGRGWRPGYGAEFEILRDGQPIDLVEPLFNRLVLFRPRSAPLHRVRPIADEAMDWKRKSVTLWWADGPAPRGELSEQTAASG